MKSFFNRKSKENTDKLSNMSDENKVPDTEESQAKQENQQLPNEPVNEGEKRIAELEEQVAQLNDKYLRIYSEFDNFRRRTAREKVEMLKEYKNSLEKEAKGVGEKINQLEKE